MIETDYNFKKIEEYKEKILKEQIYSEYNVKKYESCPHCGCTHFIKHGKYEGIQRYRCKNDKCRKTFSSTTCSVWKYLKHKPEKWLKFIELMCENISLQRCADILKITISTAFYWRHKVFHGIENCYKPKSFKEHIVVSNFYTHKCYKGSRSKHFTKEQSLNNKISRLFAYAHNDVGILICVEGDEIPLINVKYEKEKLIYDFEKNISNYINKNCYIHLNKVRLRKIEEFTMEHNKNLPCGVIKKYGFKIRKNLSGIPHIEDKFQVSSNAGKFIGELNSWLYRFKGIATKYLNHYFNFYSLIHSSRHFDSIKIFRDLLKNSFFTSCYKLKSSHLENY